MTAQTEKALGRPATPSERIDEIMGLMGRDEWNADAFAAMLVKHGVSRATLERDASEAGRTLERLHAGTPAQREEARGQLLVRLAHWRRLAVGRTKAFVKRSGDVEEVVEVADPDLTTIARLEDIAAKVLGAYAPVKLEAGLPGEFAALSTAELIVRALEQHPELGEKVAGMLAAKRDVSGATEIETTGEPAEPDEEER